MYYGYVINVWKPFIYRHESNHSGAKKKIQDVRYTMAKEIKSYALTKYANYVKNY